MPRKIREIPWTDTESNGYYYVYWYDKKAKRTQRKSLDTKDPVEAQARFTKFLNEGHEIYTGATDGLTVSQALDFYHREHLVKHVVDLKRAERINEILKRHFKDTPLKDIDIDACEQYGARRRSGELCFEPTTKHPATNRGAADPTIRRELMALLAAAYHNRERKRITLADFPVVKRPPDSEIDPIGDNDWLTPDELLNAVESAREMVYESPVDAMRLADFIVMCYDSGSRRAAIEKLSVGQVNMRSGLVTLRHPDETLNQRRSKKRRPTVPMDKGKDHPLREAGILAREVYERRVADVTAQIEAGETLSVALLGTPCNMYHPFRTLMERIGLAHKANPHILRHSRATHLLMAGESLYDVAKLLGDTVETVEKVYGHYSPQHLFDAKRRNA